MLFDLEPYLPFNLFIIIYLAAFTALAAWIERSTRDH